MKKIITLLISIVITSMHVHGQLNKSFVDLNSTRMKSSIDVDFGTVADFIIFTGAGAVANTGISTVTGNVGTHAGTIAGFGAPSVLNGVEEIGNTVTLQASLDLAAACIELQNIPATITDHSGVFGSVAGETIFPGVYSIAAAVSITGTLTLDAQGDPDAIFLFKITGALNSVAGATVLLANGASSDNVFWIATGAVGLGANTSMIGTAIAYPGAVSLGAGGSMDGRLYTTVGAIATDSFEATIPVAVIADTTIPVISLVGDPTISLELGTSYTDAGATASDNIDGDITGNITTNNPVDINTAGVYTITYNVSDDAGNAATQVTRDVTVIADTTKPIITLVGNSAISLELGTGYTDAGATASDNIDGDITENITTNNPVDINTAGVYTITYNVSDDAGNAATQVTRDVTVADTTNPIITLVGNSAISLELGTGYTDAGATASDNIDGDITGNITTNNPVDINTAGVYTITYNVSDVAGNPATQVARDVTITALPAYNFLGAYTANGTPLYLESPSDVVSTEAQEIISNSLPDGYPVPDYNPQYTTSGYDTDIKIESSTDIWVTFVKEDASTANVLGFYTYDIYSPVPITKPTKDDITIIFPNISDVESGGGLVVGDKVNIGTFDANIGIGWVLLNDAWSSTDGGSVGDTLLDLYSHTNFNPESEESLRTHNVLLNDVTNERIVLGFEDSRRDNVNNSQDFNDAVFYITASTYASLNTTNFVDITQAYDVTSGNDGGLESNGDLANLIAKRNFKRKKEGNLLNKKEAQLIFNKNKSKAKTSTNTLIDYLPETGMYGTETANVSSPTDLLGVTNAKEILAVDYYQGEKRISAVLATKTEGAIYDHSKIICDRLNNSSLEDIRTVETRGHQIISSKIKRVTGEIEYALGFSIKIGSAENELFSFWNIDQYPTGNYQNFQIWGSSFSQVFSIANFIIDKHSNDHGLISTKVANVLPDVFVKSGSYANGVLELFLVNKTNETSIIFDGNIAETEVSEHYNITRNLSLTGNYNETLYIDTGVLFDIGFSLQTDNTAQKDALYLADGPWGLDYLEEYATVEEFTIEVGERSYLEDVYEVDRNASASGQVKGNINLFRHLLPGDQTLDVTNYSFMNFSLRNNQPVEIVIMQEDNGPWDNRLRYTVAANSDEKDYNIAFNNFKDAEGVVVEITNIKTIVFSVIGDYVNSIPFSITVNDVSFSSQSSLSTNNTAAVKENKLINYPNPFTNSTTIKLATNSEFIQIKVFDILGRLVDNKKLNTANSENEAQYNAPNLKSGIYKYLLKDDNNNSHSGTFIVN
jgi:hypothetical protein